MEYIAKYPMEIPSHERETDCSNSLGCDQDINRMITVPLISHLNLRKSTLNSRFEFTDLTRTQYTDDPSLRPNYGEFLSSQLAEMLSMHRATRSAPFPHRER